MHADYLRTYTRENVELGYGKINGDRVNLRSGPSTGYRVVAKGYQNEKAYIIGFNTGWYKVIFDDQICYIRSDYLDLTEIPYENHDSTRQPLFFRGGKSTGIKPSASALKQHTAPVTSEQIILTANKYLGVPYVWGGSTPNGFDCSGYTQYVFNAHHISIPRTTDTQYAVGTYVEQSQLKPGDLVFFANTYREGISHVGIYLGDGQFIHASSSKGVTISQMDNPYYASRYYGARRILQ
jgi:cell wall-associated NlpC family hydrolase